MPVFGLIRSRVINLKKSFSAFSEGYKLHVKKE